MKSKIMDMMYYLQLLILIHVLHMLIIVKIKGQITFKKKKFIKKNGK